MWYEGAERHKHLLQQRKVQAVNMWACLSSEWAERLQKHKDGQAGLMEKPRRISHLCAQVRDFYALKDFLRRVFCKALLP